MGTHLHRFDHIQLGRIDDVVGTLRVIDGLRGQGFGDCVVVVLLAQLALQLVEQRRASVFITRAIIFGAGRGALPVQVIIITERLIALALVFTLQQQ